MGMREDLISITTLFGYDERQLSPYRLSYILFCLNKRNIKNKN